jgi:hypothetical protein
MTCCHVCRHSQQEAPLLLLDGPFLGPTCNRCRILVLQFHARNRVLAESEAADPFILDERILLGLRLRRSAELDARRRTPQLCIPSPLRMSH